MAADALSGVRWWDARRAVNTKPATYRCPICGRHLPALSDHLLLFPEGDHRRRRHAHTACVAQARQRGTLLLKDDWQRQQGGGGSWLPWRRRRAQRAP